MLIASMLPGCNWSSAPPITETTPPKTEAKAAELSPIATINLHYDDSKLRSDLEKLSKQLKANDDEAKAEVEAKLGPQSTRWKELEQRLAKLKEQRESITEGLAKLGVPEAEFKDCKAKIDAVRIRPSAPLDLKKKAEEASKALDAYQKAWKAVNSATDQFAQQLQAATKEWEGLQDRYKALAAKGVPKPDEQRKFSEDAAKILGDATALGLDPNGKIRTDGPLKLMMESYKLFEGARNDFWSKLEALRNAPGLSDGEKAAIDEAANKLRSKDSDFVKAAGVVVKSAAETLTTIAMLQGLGVALGPWGIVAIAALFLLKNILSGGFSDGSDSNSSNSVPGGKDRNKEGDKNGDKGGADVPSGNANDRAVTVEDTMRDSVPVAGPRDGDWAFTFDTNDSTQDLLVYLERKADRSQKRALMICAKDSKSDDLKAIRDTYQKGKLAFERFSVTDDKSATGLFRADKDGKRALFKLTWDLADLAAEPTTDFVAAP